MNNKAFFKYIFALLLFGSNGIVASFIDLSSQNIVLLRTFLGSVLLIAIFFISGGKVTFFYYKKQFIFIVLSGIAMGASWMFLYEAYSRIGVSIASLLYYCGPVIVIALSSLIFKERLSTNKIIGFITVLVGIVFVNGNICEGKIDFFGIICGLFSAVMYAFMVIFNKKANKIVGLENSVLQLTIAFFTVAIFVGVTQGYSMQISHTSLLPIFVLGTLNTAIGCYLYFSSIGKLQVHTVAICGYIEPLSAVLLSALLLNEKMSPIQLAGAVLIIVGAVFFENALSKILKQDHFTLG